MPDARVVVVLRDPYDFLLSYKFAHQRREDRAAEEVMWHPTGISMLWRSYWRAAADARDRFGDRVLVTRLEDIRDDGAAQFDSMLDFLDLAPYDVMAGAPERDNSSFSGDRPELDPGDIAAFNLVAKRDALAAGYQVRASGLSWLGTARASAGVVPWALRNARAARQRTDGGLIAYAKAALFRR